MGQKYILVDGKQVAISDNVLPVQKSDMICFGQVVTYRVGAETRIGKITGARDNKIIISKVAKKSRVGYQFSMTDTDTIESSNIINRLVI
jgi:hypothetical protein